MSNWKNELYEKVKEYPAFIDQLSQPERQAVLDVAREQLDEIQRLTSDMVDKANMNFERSGCELVYDGDIQTAQRFYHTEKEKVYQIIRLIQGEPEKKERTRPDKAKLCGFKTIADRDHHICQRVNDFLKSGYQKTTAYLEVAEELELSHQQIGKIYTSGK